MSASDNKTGERWGVDLSRIESQQSAMLKIEDMFRKTGNQAYLDHVVARIDGLLGEHEMSDDPEVEQAREVLTKLFKSPGFFNANNIAEVAHAYEKLQPGPKQVNADSLLALAEALANDALGDIYVPPCLCRNVITAFDVSYTRRPAGTTERRDELVRTSYELAARTYRNDTTTPLIESGSNDLVKDTIRALQLTRDDIDNRLQNCAFIVDQLYSDNPGRTFDYGMNNLENIMEIINSEADDATKRSAAEHLAQYKALERVADLQTTVDTLTRSRRTTHTLIRGFHPSA